MKLHRQNSHKWWILISKLWRVSLRIVWENLHIKFRDVCSISCGFYILKQTFPSFLVVVAFENFEQQFLRVESLRFRMYHDLWWCRGKRKENYGWNYYVKCNSNSTQLFRVINDLSSYLLHEFFYMIINLLQTLVKQLRVDIYSH